jgi:hypothetical protein
MSVTGGSGSEGAPVYSGDDDLPAYSKDGVDLTLIRWMLTLTPIERLEVAQSGADAVRGLRRDEAED